jgi:hypothetical protein
MTQPLTLSSDPLEANLSLFPLLSSEPILP